MLLPPSSLLGVLTMDGQHMGTLIRADGYSVRLLTDGLEQQVARADVLRIDLLHLPGSDAAAVAKRTAGGAVLGVGAAALFAGVLGGAAWPPPGVFLRAGAAVGGTGAAAAAIPGRQPQGVYIAENQYGPMRRPAAAVEAQGSARDARREPRVSYAAEEWGRIIEIESSTVLTVVMLDGVRHRGKLAAVDEFEIRLDDGGVELRIPRRSVRRVDVQ